MTRIKICGLSRIEDIIAANEIRPEYVGFVFAKKSVRRVSPEQAAALKSRLCPEIKAVGVYVNEDVNTVADHLNSGIINIAQLHGNEGEEYIKALRKLTEKPIIKAFIIKSHDDVQAAAASSADFILLDSGRGSGKPFDIGLIGDIGREFFLAGGLDCENVAEAVEAVRPFAIDVSSGVESAAGIKSPQLMEKFVREVRGVR